MSSSGGTPRIRSAAEVPTFMDTEGAYILELTCGKCHTGWLA